MKSASLRGLTWLEVLILIVLLLFLVSLTIPSIGVGLTKGKMTRTLSNMKQLHLATQQMTLDNQTTGGPIRWTCSNTTPLSFEQWKKTLVGEYLSASDMQKLLSASEERPFWFDKWTENAITVFAVEEADSPMTLLLATKNWHGVSTPDLSGKPYGKSGFIIFCKGGSGAILQPKQAGDTNIIGSGGIHHYLPLQ